MIELFIFLNYNKINFKSYNNSLDFELNEKYFIRIMIFYICEGKLKIGYIFFHFFNIFKVK